MYWTGITIEVPSDEAEEAVTQLLLNAGCSGVALGSAGGQRTVGSYLPTDDRIDDHLRQIRAALSLLSALGIASSSDVVVTEVNEEDWANSWKAYFKPIRIGKRMVVTPPWETPELQPKDLVVTIDPGMAFGTGTHGTTQLCMVLLEEYLRPGDTAADIGTGSGILAITAKKLGAESVIAVDNDPLAVKIAAENALVNETNFLTSGDFPSGQKFDVVVANIIADTIIALADDLASIVESGGILIASGIIDDRQDNVRIFVEAAGFTALETRSQGEWVALVFRRAAE